MKIIYGKTIFDKIKDERDQALKEGKHIDKIILEYHEWDELILFLEKLERPICIFKNDGSFKYLDITIEKK